MKFSKKIKIVLFTLLIALIIILHIPFFPHECGADTYIMHILANSVSEFGCAEWWVNKLSIFGLYPYSECSAVPFVLSGISQCTGIDIEKVILLFCMILGLFTIFAAYIMAGEIIDDDLFKFLVAFGFSISPAILNYLVWSTTARSPFIALLPLFTYSLFKCRTYKLRYGFLTLILGILLFATHHLAYFLIPIFIGYFIVVIAYKLKSHIKFESIKIPENFITFALVISFLVMLAIPFQTGHFIVGSRYAAPINIFLGNLPRYIGVLGIFAVGGFTYLLFKHDKRFEEWALLFILLFLTPFLYAQTYMKWFIPCFICLLIGIGLINIAKLDGQKRKYALTMIIIFLLLSVSFSGFYQHWRTKEGVRLFEDYTKESTYIAGLWVKENINNGSAISNDIMLGRRVFAVSRVPLFTGSGTADHAYGFVNVSEFQELKKRSITEEDFWFGGPYEAIGWESELYRREILRGSYEYYEDRYSSRFNFTHVIEDKKLHGKFTYHGINPSKFIHDMYDKKNCIYDNGAVGGWNLN